MIQRSERVGGLWHITVAACVVAVSGMLMPTTASAASKLERFTQETSSRLKKFSRTAANYAEGIASYYGRAFQGRPTASGEPFNMYEMTGAHKTLPLNSLVRVTNLENGLSVIVRITDRGPYVRNRIIDLSYAAAKRLKMLTAGTVAVKLARLGEGHASASDLADAPAPSAQDKNPEKFYVRLGNYASPEGGQDMLDQLGDMIHVPSRLKPVSQDEQQRYAVVLGPFASRNEAIALAGKLHDKGIQDLRVVGNEAIAKADEEYLSSTRRYSVLDLVPPN